METLMELRPWTTTGMVVLQAESEIASINMVYGGAACGKRCMTSSSSPGISLMNEGISYIAGAELPALIVNISRGGPGLGTIQPSQADYFQATKGGGHGDYHLIVLAPSSVQEMHDFVFSGFDLAFKYRNPVMILADGVIGQMMEKVELSPMRPRWTDEEVKQLNGSWAVTGKQNRERHIITSVELDSLKFENFNHKLVEKYAKIRENEVRYEETLCSDAEYLIVAYGTSARIGQKAVELLRAGGIKVGLFRPITLYPFPQKELASRAKQLKGILTVELSAGQMVEDVKLAVGSGLHVEHYGRMGGMIHTPNEIVNALTKIWNLKLENC
jgi:2-oxoglutarate ferredoxin oxidoreductase subunit alpha